jgi:hypothetical protein
MVRVASTTIAASVAGPEAAQIVRMAMSEYICTYKLAAEQGPMHEALRHGYCYRNTRRTVMTDTKMTQDLKRYEQIAEWARRRYAAKLHPASTPLAPVYLRTGNPVKYRRVEELAFERYCEPHSS